MKEYLEECFGTCVSVDVETAGPNPGQYSLLSIGACMVAEPLHTFYVELRPVNERFTTEALTVSGLSLEELAARGVPPAQAMASFEMWVQDHVLPGQRPIFVAFNAPFDWMFVNDYFHRYLGHNPFGYAALDLKSFYMGLTGAHWSETSMIDAAARYLDNRQLTHHALQDALDQAELFRKMLAEAVATRRK